MSAEMKRLNAHAREATLPLARFPTITEDAWLAKKLGRRDLLVGLVEPEARRERVRERILAISADCGAAPGDFVAGVRNGQPETWAQLFERLYGQPLVADAETQPTTER